MCFDVVFVNNVDVMFFEMNGYFLEDGGEDGGEDGEI